MELVAQRRRRPSSARTSAVVLYAARRPFSRPSGVPGVVRTHLHQASRLHRSNDY
jgi:hypothetical protein